MSTIDEDDVTFEDIATLCEESQDELADLLLQEGPFYSFIKNEQNSEFDATPDAQVDVSRIILSIRVVVCGFLSEKLVTFLLNIC